MRIGKRILLKITRACKDYKCDQCRGDILHTDKYTKADMKADGIFVTKKYCLRHNWKEVNVLMRTLRDEMEKPSDEWDHQERLNEDQKEEDAGNGRI